MHTDGRRCTDWSTIQGDPLATRIRYYHLEMTDIEKIEAYDDVIAMLDERLALEKHHREAGRATSSDTVLLLRSDAYEDIVKRLLRCNEMPTGERARIYEVGIS
jgi:hypothetical protein